MRQNLFDTKLFDPLVQRGLKLQQVTETLSGNKTLDKDEGVSFFLTSGHASDGTTHTIALPDPSDFGSGALVAFNIGVVTTPATMLFQETTTTSARTVATLDGDEGVLLISNGKTWKALVGGNT